MFNVWNSTLNHPSSLVFSLEIIVSCLTENKFPEINSENSLSHASGEQLSNASGKRICVSHNFLFY
jgi:hypothetical protein